MMFSFFLKMTLCAKWNALNLTNKLLNTKDLEVIIQPNLPKSYQVSLKNLGNAGSIDIQKRQYMPHLDVYINCPISWMSYQKNPRTNKKWYCSIIYHPGTRHLHLWFFKISNAMAANSSANPGIAPSRRALAMTSSSGMLGLTNVAPGPNCMGVTGPLTPKVFQGFPALK